MDSVSPAQIWTGRAVSGLAVLFLTFDAAIKVLKLEPAVKGTVELGFPANSVAAIGFLLLVGLVLYVVPRSSVLGAIYLTAYLGGAVAAHVRLANPLFSHTLFPTYVAAMVWGGLALRSPRLRGVLLGSDPR